MERQNRLLPGEACWPAGLSGKGHHIQKVSVNQQESAEAIVLERGRAERKEWESRHEFRPGTSTAEYLERELPQRGNGESVFLPRSAEFPAGTPTPTSQRSQYASGILLNRRIPNGTYGGVGGRGLVAPSYPVTLIGVL